MDTGALGKLYQDGDIIIKQGEFGDCMYVVQDGEVEILREQEGSEVHLGYAKVGEIIGEMAIFENECRSATVRAKGEVRLLTVDKKNFMRRVHEDPSIAYRLVQNMSRRIRDMNSELSRVITKQT